MGLVKQWLENVDQTHLVLASGKQVLQKTIALSAGSTYNLPESQSHFDKKPSYWTVGHRLVIWPW